MHAPPYDQRVLELSAALFIKSLTFVHKNLPNSLQMQHQVLAMHKNLDVHNLKIQSRKVYKGLQKTKNSGVLKVH